MNYKILKNGELINTIVADEAFVTAYCSEMGYTFEGVPKEPSKDKTDLPLSTEERVTALEAENHSLKLENHLLGERVGALTKQNSFHEELIAEMASVVYG